MATVNHIVRPKLRDRSTLLQIENDSECRSISEPSSKADRGAGRASPPQPSIFRHREHVQHASHASTPSTRHGHSTVLPPRSRTGPYPPPALDRYRSSLYNCDTVIAPPRRQCVRVFRPRVKRRQARGPGRLAAQLTRVKLPKVHDQHVQLVSLTCRTDPPTSPRTTMIRTPNAQALR